MSNSNRWLLPLVLAPIAACGTPPPADSGMADTGAVTDIGVATDAASDAPVTEDAAADAPVADVLNPGSVNGCAPSSFADRTGAAAVREVHFHSPRYSVRCMTVAAGQSILFMGEFALYPLAPGNAPSRIGDPMSSTPNPIPEQSTGSDVVVAFPTAGIYGFYSPGNEATTGMYGAIQVQ